MDVVVADHVQRVMKPNFAASWDEIGDENQVEETYSLSTMKDIPGEMGVDGDSHVDGWVPEMTQNSVWVS